MELLDSLLKMKKMWQWLADHPEVYCKETALKELELPSVDNHCYACAYDSQEGLGLCGNCALTELWGYQEEMTAPCNEGVNSPFYNWKHSQTNMQRKRAALDMVRIIDRRIRDFDYAIIINGEVYIK